MLQPVDPLMVQFLAWVASRRRTYAEAMEAWQTTCPRHTVWEDALIDGLVLSSESRFAVSIRCNAYPQRQSCPRRKQSRFSSR